MTIDRFQGPMRWLSNFEPCEVHFEGGVYPSSEHAYQAAKFLDPEKRKQIAALPTPAAAKKAGAIRNNPEIRPDWFMVALRVMEAVVLDKFSRNPGLRQKLLDTGDEELIEGNTWGDTFWGVCKGVGSNHLGRILMNVRASLRKEP